MIETAPTNIRSKSHSNGILFKQMSRQHQHGLSSASTSGVASLLDVGIFCQNTTCLFETVDLPGLESFDLTFLR